MCGGMNSREGPLQAADAAAFAESTRIDIAGLVTVLRKRGRVQFCGVMSIRSILFHDVVHVQLAVNMLRL